MKWKRSIHSLWHITKVEKYKWIELIKLYIHSVQNSLHRSHHNEEEEREIGQSEIFWFHQQSNVDTSLFLRSKSDRTIGWEHSSLSIKPFDAIEWVLSEEIICQNVHKCKLVLVQHSTLELTRNRQSFLSTNFMGLPFPSF